MYPLKTQLVSPLPTKYSCRFTSFHYFPCAGSAANLSQCPQRTTQSLWVNSAFILLLLIDSCQEGRTKLIHLSLAVCLFCRSSCSLVTFKPGNPPFLLTPFVLAMHGLRLYSSSSYRFRWQRFVIANVSSVTFCLITV